MEQKIIEEFLNLNSLINNIEGLENKSKELNEYIKLFENTIETIKNKKKDILLEDEIIRNDIKYSIDIGNYLKGKEINNIIFNEEAIRRDIKNGFSLNIRIPITPIWHNLYISLEQGISWLSITISGTNGSFINKVKEEDIKKKITEILNGYDEEGEGGDNECIYGKNINIEKDKPEEIAKKMIDLYDLLKEKIAQ